MHVYSTLLYVILSLVDAIAEVKYWVLRDRLIIVLLFSVIPFCTYVYTLMKFIKYLIYKPKICPDERLNINA